MQCRTAAVVGRSRRVHGWLRSRPVERSQERVELLMQWSERTRRDLPWRRTRDPWAILVSELMLQQTQVARVVPKFEAFMDRFSTPAACAARPIAEVIESWAGLGYNRRAVNLHRTAVVVVTEHEGVLPTALEDLLDLPGVGPYTARAILVFAHERDVGVVDTNIKRILARWDKSSLTTGEAQDLADASVPTGQSWAWHQALFDLGASVCSAQSPRCGDCPVERCCRWGGVGKDPATPAPRQSRFEGSDRQGRGLLVDALRRGPVRGGDLAATMGWPDDSGRAQRVAATLVVDALATWIEATDTWQLPQ